MKRIWKLPIRTVSEANRKEHWTVSSRRHRSQQFFVKHALKAQCCDIVLPCTVLMVRLSERQLDVSDNLPMSFKWIKDQIADCIFYKEKKTYLDKKGKVRELKGRNDDHEAITWQYGQEKSKVYGIRLEITDSTTEEFL